MHASESPLASRNTWIKSSWSESDSITDWPELWLHPAARRHAATDSFSMAFFYNQLRFFHDGDFLRKSDRGGFPVTRLHINSTLPQWRLLYLFVYLNRIVFGTFRCQNDPIWSCGRCSLFEKRGRSCGRVNLDVVVSVCLSYEWTVRGFFREILQRNTVGSSDDIGRPTDSCKWVAISQILMQNNA